MGRLERNISAKRVKGKGNHLELELTSLDSSSMLSLSSSLLSLDLFNRLLFIERMSFASVGNKSFFS